MSMPQVLAKHIANRNTPGIVDFFFERSPLKIRYGFYKEDELWDYKEDVPATNRGNEAAWAKIAADVLAFYNTKGGVLIFGIRDSDFKFVGATPKADTKLFNDKIRRYVGDRFWVSFSREFIQADQRYLGIAIVPPKAHAALRAMGDGPTIDGRKYLKTGDLCIRVADSTKILRGAEALNYVTNNRVPEAISQYIVNEPGFRVLRPDYREFTHRKDLCSTIDDALKSNRTFVTSLTGIGGVGKTALACWATLRAHDLKAFDYIVSLTAKDRALTSTGIVPLTPTLSSLSDLLTEICDVTGFSELSQIEDLPERIRSVKSSIMSQFRGLLFVDNLETVDDPQLISFLEDLPLPTRAIVTSRKSRVRVAAMPVPVGPFSESEAVEFLTHTARIRRKDSIAELSDTEKTRLANSCDRVPLVLEWFIGRARSAEKALRDAETLAAEGKHGEELLEFSFRRVYGELPEKQQAILKVLSLMGTQLPIEAIAAGADLPVHEVADQIEELKDYSLVESQYDLNYRDIAYSLLPVTSTFVYKEVGKSTGHESTVRRRLNDWYQAKEIVDPTQRELVQKVRRGERNPELALAEIARNSAATGDFDNAEQFYKYALERNQSSWQIHRELAEFYRHKRREIGPAIQHYKQAATHVPKQGPDRAKVFREFGMVLRDSGLPNAHRQAAEQLEVALEQTPKDAVCRHALGDCYVKAGIYGKGAEVLEPLLEHPSSKTREKTYPLLLTCYTYLSEQLKAAKVRTLMQNGSGDEDA
ncbi:MAG TPA: RNA-binding domain-containing protein [Edaphobacter sp.]|nr:RNA-binding domain-containing protein [Edaphobacter sp.]